MNKIDYTTLRTKAENSFSWAACSTHYAFLEQADISLKEYFTVPTAFAKAFSPRNQDMFREMFSQDVRIDIEGPATLYGQLSAFGIELVFPENGEVNYKHSDIGIDNCIELLKRDFDYSKDGYFPQYHENLMKIRELMKDDRISYQYSTEGPSTLCYAMLDMEFFLKPYDEPEKYKQMLELVTRQIVRFRRWQYKNANGITKLKPGNGLYDDLAAMLSPDIWGEFVLPYWDLFYNELCEEGRFIHCEGMTYAHLKHLQKIGITNYEPAVSPKIDPDKIRTIVDMPFSWKLESFHYPELSVQDIRDWVLKAVADGVSHVWTVVGAGMLNKEAVAKVKMFIATAKEVEEMFRQNISRKEIGNMVSSEGKAKFWSKWPE